MNRQAMVIGLGQFGMAMARSLAEHGVEVLAVDRRQDRVQAVSAFVADAQRLDATDEAALNRAAPGRRDVCVVAIGDEGKEGSILVTALLRQMGARRIVARATDALHERILLLVGAHEVVNPERAFGERLATRLAHAGILEELPLGDDLVITELSVPAVFIGRSLTDLELRRRFGVTVIAVRRVEEGHGRVLLPEPRQPLRDGDVLVVVGEPDAAARIVEGL